MTTDQDTLDGLNELAAATREREPQAAVVRRHPKRRRVPNRRVLTAGGIVLRAFGVFLVISGFWPLLWTILHAFMFFTGSAKGEAHFEVGDGGFDIRLTGWPAIIFGLTWSGLTWCVAIVAFAFGHALYAVRDLVEAQRA